VSEDVRSLSALSFFPKWNQLLGCLLGVLGLGLVIFLMEQNILNLGIQGISPFRIQEVKISSEWPIAVSDVRAWVSELNGQSLLLLNSSQLGKSLGSRPWVEHVTIKKQYPNRLRIEVETKRPRALTVVKGLAYYVDERGHLIDKARPNVVKGLDLPFISFPKGESQWKFSSVLTLMEQFRTLSQSKHSLSQVTLGNYPYLKIFLDNPRLEILINVENWQSQSKILQNLLLDPPSQLQQLQRINLIFPKKAVVSIRN
jgi:cell division protein FtsQ